MYRKLSLAWLASVSAVLSSAAHASHEIYSPIVEQGETELEFTADYVKDSSHPDDGEQAYYLEAAYGVNARWRTALLVESEKAPGDSLETEAVEWENVIQLSEQGQYFLDYGLYLEAAHALEDGAPDELAAGLLLQKDLGQFTAIANLIAEKQVGDNAEDDIEGAYSGQLRWRLNPKAEPTLEYYSDDDHKRLGTLVSGTFRQHHSNTRFGYRLGVLWGLNDDTADTLRAGIEYEF